MSNDAYVAAAMVACPRCRVAVGKPCIERYCKNGYINCDYAVCARWREKGEPHLERAVAAKQAEAAKEQPEPVHEDADERAEVGAK